MTRPRDAGAAADAMLGGHGVEMARREMVTERAGVHLGTLCLVCVIYI